MQNRSTETSGLPLRTRFLLIWFRAIVLWPYLVVLFFLGLILYFRLPRTASFIIPGSLILAGMLLESQIKRAFNQATCEFAQQRAAYELDYAKRNRPYFWIWICATPFFILGLMDYLINHSLTSSLALFMGNLMLAGLWLLSIFDEMKLARVHFGTRFILLGRLKLATGAMYIAGSVLAQYYICQAAL